MRWIDKKNGAPSLLEVWLNENEEEIKNMIADPEKSGAFMWRYFRDNAKDVYEELKESLVKDQGFICCYCGKRIQNDYQTLIEHLKPKSGYKLKTFLFENLLASCMGGSVIKIHKVEPEETLDSITEKYGVDIEHLQDVYVNSDELLLFRKKYDIENLNIGDRVVIFPIAASNEQHCDTRKGNLEIEITPLLSDCQNYFRFNPIDGKIIEDENNGDTIEKLGLNSNRYINQLRKRAIEESNILKENLLNDFGHSITEFNDNKNTIVKNLNSLSFNNGVLDAFVFVMIWNLEN